MQNFVYYNPTKVVFGKGCVDQLGAEAVQCGKKALFVHDKNATTRSGVYDQIVKSLKASGVDFVEFTQVQPNPVLADVHAGIALARKEKIDYVIAAGGGSAIDEAKAIAAGVCVEHDVWEFYSGKEPLTKALPVLSIITKSATGTETNGGSVITNEVTKEKYGLIVAPLIPKVAFMDPCVTFSVPADQTSFGAVDAISHLLEGYLTNEDPETPILNEYVEGLIRSIIAATDRILKNPSDYEARATYMWAASLAWNGLGITGIGKCSYPNHLLGHSMSAMNGVQHGASISIAFSGWMPYFIKESEANAKKMAHFGKVVFGVTETDVNKAAETTVEIFRNWCKKTGSPTTLAELDIDDAGLEKIAENVALCAPMWGLPGFNKEHVVMILKMCK
ncbi:MAG: iron-containing alcohol dehydrogenase [Thermoguttaceae bacterium]